MEKVNKRGASKRTDKRKAPGPKRINPLTGVFNWLLNFFKRNWLGTLVILTATLIFFWPVVTRISSYSEGGDAMFNAWTLARDHHCLMHDGCPSYSTSNIYFPHKDTMLYSETQLSAGFVTLPLYWINDNPLFSNNVLTIVSCFLAGWFMYLLAKYLSKGNEIFSILAGLIFEFAPFKMAAIWHLQNLSIFCLPLAILLIMKFFDTNNRKYLWGLGLTLIYQFYASWYQMVFVAIAVSILAICMLLIRYVNWRQALMVLAVLALAAISTLPLAEQYIRFSKTNKATFGIIDQARYSSSVADYFIPHNGTAIGKAYYHFRPGATVNGYNADSYSYHGLTLYIVALLVLGYAFRRRRAGAKALRDYREIVAFSTLGLVGLILSLGPLLKLKGSYSYAALSDGTGLAVPMPYLLVDKFLPQLSFIRAIGRVSVLFLVALCCLLAYFAKLLTSSKLSISYKRFITVLVSALIIIELMPLHRVPMYKYAYAYNLKVPAVYQYIKKHKQIDNIVILQAREYYGAPYEFARSEDTLWSGYYNRNIFNGYSGYTPPKYDSEYVDFVNFDSGDIPKMKKLGLKYVLVDKQLMNQKAEAVKNAHTYLPAKVYEDGRYSLFKITK